MTTTNEVDLVIKYANEKGGSADGQMIIDSVELQRSRDNRTYHGIGNEDPQDIQGGNKTYTFSATAYMNKAQARACKRMFDGDAEAQAVYVRDDDVFDEKAEGLDWNEVTTSSSDGGDTTVDVSADLLGLNLTVQG